MNKFNVLSIDSGKENNYLILVQVTMLDQATLRHEVSLVKHEKYIIPWLDNRSDRYKAIWIYAEKCGMFNAADVLIVEEGWTGIPLEYGAIWFSIGIAYNCYTTFISPRKAHTYFGTGTGTHYTNKLMAVEKYKNLGTTYGNTSRYLDPRLLCVRMDDLDHYADALLKLLYWLDNNWWSPYYLYDHLHTFNPKFPEIQINLRKRKARNPANNNNNNSKRVQLMELGNGEAIALPEPAPPLKAAEVATIESLSMLSKWSKDLSQ